MSNNYLVWMAAIPVLLATYFVCKFIYLMARDIVLAVARKRPQVTRLLAAEFAAAIALAVAAPYIGGLVGYAVSGMAGGFALMFLVEAFTREDD